MKKFLLIVLFIVIAFTSCAQKQNSNIENVPQQIVKLNTNANTSTFNPQNMTIGFAFAYIDDGVIKSDLAGIKIGENELIDDVALLTIGGITVNDLFISGEFSDVLENIRLDVYKDPKVYCVYDGTVYKSDIRKIDVFFDSGMAEFFVKIYSNVPKEISSENIAKFPCIISEQELEIQVPDNEKQENLEEKKIIDIITINGTKYFFKADCSETLEMYEVYEDDRQKIFEIYFSEP